MRIRFILTAGMLLTVPLPHRAVSSVNGSLQVNAAAAMGGSKFGLEVSASGKRTWIESRHPIDEKVLVVRFLLDPHTLSLPAGSSVSILRLYAGKNRHHVKLMLKPIKARRFALDAFARSNRGSYTHVGSGVVRRNRETEIELIWYAASHRQKSDGGLALLIDGRLVAAELMLGNGKLTVKSVRLGIMDAATSEIAGSFFLDEYSSFRAFRSRPWERGPRGRSR